jgi:alpha-L-fucosidase
VSLGSRDIRFTANKTKTIVYAFVMGWPEQEVVIEALGTSTQMKPTKVANVELLGHGGRLDFRQGVDALKVKFPAERPCDYAYALKIVLA